VFNMFSASVIQGKPVPKVGFSCALVLWLGVILGLWAPNLWTQIQYLPGWPVDTNGSLTSAIYIADVDDDGQPELVYGDRSFGSQTDWWLYVKKMDGSDAPGWPQNRKGSEAPKGIFDSDNDGKLEIVSTYSGLYMLDSTGTELWYHPYNGPIFQSLYLPGYVSVDDIDNDGNQEIVVTCVMGGAVFVFDAQGNVRPGWPVTGLGGMLVSASLGDIDGDGLKEIIVSSDKIYCFKPDSTSCGGFPYTADNGSLTKPILIDYNGDGHPEIIFGTTGPHWGIYAIDYAGNLISPYPLDKNSMLQGSVGDIYRNGNYELIYGWLSLRGYDLMTATQLPDFPFTDPSGLFGFSSKAPNLCDLSDDPGIEIASGAYSGGFVYDGKLFAFNTNGQVLSGFPSSLLFHRGLTTGCAVNDLDGDGDIEICCGSENLEFTVPRSSTIYCWDSPHPYNLDNIDWAMDGFDLGHTGRWRRLYHISKAGSQLAVGSCQGQGNPCYLPPNGSLIAVDVTAVREHGGANPSGQDVRYSRTLGCANYEGPVVDHGDGTYTRMLRAPTADCATDIHAWVNEFKLADYQQIIFTSGCVAAPPAFSLIAPPDKAEMAPPNITLEWQTAGTAPHPDHAASYDLYFGPEPDPPCHQGGLLQTYFDLHGLAPGTTYTWRVEAHNACGATPSPVWSFTTAPDPDECRHCRPVAPP